ncbi:hypothetical protein G7054_g7792 [Neopestalotiopsis clavispora]|nr:hypothetical protein G7054_g7792 [Neopestalotiopsis clavispora]
MATKASVSKATGRVGSKSPPKPSKDKDSKTGLKKGEFHPLTKGVEFEFAVPWRFDVSEDGTEGKKLEDDKLLYTLQDGYVMVARGHIPRDVGPWTGADAVVRRAVYDVLTAHGLQVNKPNGTVYDEEDDDGDDADHPRAAISDHPGFLRWSIVCDSSITTDMKEEDWEQLWDPPQTEFELTDVELTTPVLLANNDESDNEIRQALGILLNQFLCLTPESTGLHVHVGNGPHVWPEEDLKRVASALFAIDIYFKGLHPIHRRLDNVYHRITREKAIVAKGYSAKQAKEMVYGTLQHPGRNGGPQPDNAITNGTAIDVMRAMMELMAAYDNAVVKTLMFPSGTGVYNFANVVEKHKKTIEFRQGAGSLNAEWAIHWSNLCAGIVDWARRATDDDKAAFFTSVEMKEAFPDNRVYNPITLIRDRFNLPAVADYLQQTLTPDHRATPKVTGQQAEWREYLRRNSDRRLGQTMRPRPDWPIG